jgi:hypothetical protein
MRSMILVDHKVADYEAWKRLYDGFRQEQRERGVRWQMVLRDPVDAARVVVLHAFDTHEAAQAFLDDSVLREAMQEGGVDASSLKVDFFDEVDAGNV